MSSTKHVIFLDRMHLTLHLLPPLEAYEMEQIMLGYEDHYVV